MNRVASVMGILATLLVTVPACMDEGLAEDGENEAFPDGKADGGLEEGSPDALGVLALVNDSTMSAAALKSAAKVTTRVANNITAHRDGADQAPDTGDDDRFDTLAELDAVKFVGPATLRALLQAARDRGLVPSEGASVEVVFSPQPAADSHLTRIAKMIREAKESVDIAMYSYSDANIAAALREARTRGVKIRFLFETANKDKGITDPAMRASSKSGRIEADGIDVRFVNKILHHKFVIVDGPRDDIDRAATAQLVTGSANWSSTAATVFDEATFFVKNSAELLAAYQHEFDALWVGSREFTGPAARASPSTANITPDDVADEAGLAALFTRANMKAAGADGTTWSTDKNRMAVSDQFVAAINRAKTSIHVASGHLRLRPVAQALIARKQADPSLDIKVYLDQQEWISASGDSFQKAEVAECEASATTTSQLRDCGSKSFLFSKSLVDAGIDVRYKIYSYRWDHSFAAQMHSKYLIVDGTELLSGSYNLSMNAEHSTFENVIHLSGAQFKTTIDKFEQNFATIIETGRAGDLLSSLRTQISTAQTIPLVFPSMSLSWQQYQDLKDLIRQNCTQVDSTEFRSNAASHRTCPR